MKMASLGCFESFPGTVIILPATDTTPFQQWTIGEQLSEDMHQQTKSAVEKGMGPSYAAAKFYCHSIDRDEKAMMRIHLQVPNVSTELSSSATRACQAVSAPEFCEISAFKALRWLRNYLLFTKESRIRTALFPGALWTISLGDCARQTLHRGKLMGSQLWHSQRHPYSASDSISMVMIVPFNGKS